MIRLWHELRLAIGFLSRIPVRTPANVEAVHLGRCMAFFPLVGLLLGGLLTAADAGLATLLPRPVVDALLLVLLALFSGALHLDGFADLCDGVGGGRDRESTLRIMKDSHIGAFGAVGLILLVLVKYQALSSVPAPVKPMVLLVMPALGRWAPVLLTVTVPYLRGPEGTGSAFAAHAGRRELLVSSLIVLAAASLVLKLQGLLLCAGAVLAIAVFGGWIKGKLGGVTGDVLGASVELVEVTILLLVLVLARG